ncbi:MAG: ComF family protein [bacterium]
MLLRIRSKISYFFKSVLDFLFPPICFGCNKEIDSGIVCYQCYNKITGSWLGVCAQCGYPLGYNQSCKNCKSSLTLPRIRALGFYTEPFLPLIHALKYQGKKSLAEIFGKALTGLLNSDPILKQAEVLVPVPLHPARKRERGFNQSELLGFEVSRLTGIPVVNALRRKKNTKSQTTLDSKKRIENMQEAFIIKDNKTVVNKKVILIDDVITSGATINSAAQTLLEAGVREVFGLVIARA